MAGKGKAYVPGYVQEALAGFASVGADSIADWSAQTGFELPQLVAALVAADAGIMLRAAEQRRAVAVGVFAGGTSAWVTVRTTAELAEALSEATVTLEGLAGSRSAPEPTPKGRKSGKGRS